MFKNPSAIGKKPVATAPKFPKKPNFGKGQTPPNFKPPSAGQVHFHRHATAAGKCFKKSGMTVEKLNDMSREDRVSFSSEMNMCAETSMKLEDMKRDDYLRSSDTSALENALKSLWD